MQNDETKRLSDSLFLVDVEDGTSGEVYQTLSISRTPAMLLSFAANKFTEAASNYFRVNFGLGTVDWRMLLLLGRMPGVTAVHAARTIGVDKGTVSRCVARLCESNLIIAGEVHANGRSRGLSLTLEGRALHDKILTAALRQQALLLKDFDEADVKILCELLARFKNNLDALIASDSQSQPVD